MERREGRKAKREEEEGKREVNFENEVDRRMTLVMVEKRSNSDEIKAISKEVQELNRKGGE